MELTHYKYCLEIAELYQLLSETWTPLEPYHTDQSIHGVGEAAQKKKKNGLTYSSKELSERY